MYRFESLDGVSLPQLAECFNLAFSDYEQPIKFTPESLQYYLTASTVDLALSFGAFCDDRLVGFILNSAGIYHDENVVFDAGTGVVPEHRGKKVFSGLFAYTAQQLQRKGIVKYCLEVLQSNHHAQSIYEKVGFSIRRAYTVLAATGAATGEVSGVAVAPYQDFAAFDVKFAVQPSYEHTTHTIDKNPGLYEVRYLAGQAYCIYAKRNGLILQLHYNTLDALEKVLSAHLQQYPSAWAKNIDCACEDVIQMFERLGFAEVTRQYEMARDL
jgi:GNAT superfamily N-acetyltransferase